MLSRYISNHLPRFVVCPALLLFATTAFAHSLPDRVARLLQDYRIPVSAVSIDVRQMETGRSVLSLNSDVPRTPASVIKVLTTLAALEMLGPHYQWETRYLADGQIKQGVLHGDLVLKGGGDPFLTVEQFWGQVLDIRQRGIQTITGDLIIDNTLFRLPNHDRSAFDNEPARLYNVGPDAALVNSSATNFVIQPRDGRAIVFASPPMAGLEIENQLTLSDGKCYHPGHGWQYGIHRKNEKIIARFKGKYRRSCDQYSFGRSIVPNLEYTYRLFAYLWTSTGGRFNGGYRVERTPSTARPLATHASRPLADMITGINKFSTNALARQLMLGLDAQDENKPATIEGARRAIGDWLTASNLPMPLLKLDNGSGLSRQTQITSGDLEKLLQYGWHSNFRAEFLSSLALVALDGTMKKRLVDSNLTGRARIKTGWLKGVRSMTGYVHARNGTWYSVTLIIESGSIRYKDGNRIQDALLKWVYDLPAR